MNTTSNTSNRANRLSPSFLLLLISCVLIIVGYNLMSGAGSTEQAFNPDIFSFRRVVIAPMLCLAGYLLIIVGILRYK